MWLVYDSEEGLILVTDNYKKAKAEYERSKDFFKKSEEFYGDERLVLARIKKDFYSYETDKKTPEEDNYWDWRETIY